MLQGQSKTVESSVRVRRWQITPTTAWELLQRGGEWGGRAGKGRGNSRERITTPWWTVTDYNNMAALSILQLLPCEWVWGTSERRWADVIRARQSVSTAPEGPTRTRVITSFSMSLSCFSPPSLERLLLLLPLSLALGEPCEPAGDTGRRHGVSGVLAGALMMRRLLV